MGQASRYDAPTIIYLPRHIINVLCPALRVVEVDVHPKGCHHTNTMVAEAPAPEQACKAAKGMTTKGGRRWIKDRKNPMVESYRPENDVSDLLGDELPTRYMQLIGTLRWGVGLGRVGTTTGAPVLPSCSCSPRAGHTGAACQTPGHVRSHWHNAAAEAME